MLEDGREFTGYGMGSHSAQSGEVVFNTAMTGYVESLTDPSYCGQILTLTYPLIGNYGTPPNRMHSGMRLFFESHKIHVKALVISDYCHAYSHWNAACSLHQWLAQSGVPAIYGVDTRAITKHIREHGVMRGKIVPDGIEEPSSLANISFDDISMENLAASVSCSAPQTYGSGMRTIVLVDYGSKHNIVRCLVQRGVRVVCVPWDYDFTQIEHDGVMLSNGPGNPLSCGAAIDNIRKALHGSKPIFGICLGHQLLALAAGASTFKMKYGHRSHNQPVQMARGGRAFITSQNHGYAVDAAALPAAWQPFCINLNDNTNEGICHVEKPFFSVQFHPEACGGPTDTEFLFDDFLAKVEEYSK